jgi:hypothetical protein
MALKEAFLQVFFPLLLLLHSITDNHFYHLSILSYHLLTREVSVTRQYVFIFSVFKLEALCL